MYLKTSTKYLKEIVKIILIIIIFNLINYIQATFRKYIVGIYKLKNILKKCKKEFTRKVISDILYLINKNIMIKEGLYD